MNILFRGINVQRTDNEILLKYAHNNRTDPNLIGIYHEPDADYIFMPPEKLQISYLKKFGLSWQ